MSNVVPLHARFRSNESPELVLKRERAALAADLVTIMERIWAAGDRAAALGEPGIETERLVQNLVDAVSSLERAAEALTEDGEWTPF